MKRVFVYILLLLNFIPVFSQNISISYNSVYYQYEDYLKMYDNIVKSVYYALNNNDKNDSISISELTFKIIPSSSPQRIRYESDTMLITLVIDYKILPKFVYIFQGQKLLSVMTRQRLGYDIENVNPNSKQFSWIKNDKKMILHFCPYDNYLLIENNDFKMFRVVWSEGLLEDKNDRLELFKYLQYKFYQERCDPDDDELKLPGLGFDLDSIK